MATINGFNVTINKMCRAKDVDCVLAYTYNVGWDDSEEKEKEFNVKALLWGGSSFNLNYLFVDSTDDAHTINRSTPMPVTRAIPVKCDQLDRLWGDNIIIKLVLSPEGEEDVTYEAVASTEMEHEMMATPHEEAA